MPNWCSSSLTITGDAENIKRFTDGLNRDENGTIRIFRSFIPMPEGLENTVSGWTSDEEEQARRAVLDAENILKYGHANWYDWQYANWGVKWGDCDSEIIDAGDTSISLYFMTPWGTANEAWKTISAMFPTLTFSFYHDEEGGFFAGADIYRNGEIVFEKMYAPSDNPHERDFDDDESFEKHLAWQEEQRSIIEDAVDEFLNKSSH